MVKHLFYAAGHTSPVQDIGKARWRAKRTLPECPGDRTLRSERRCTIPEQKRQQYGAHSPSGMSASRFEEDSGWRKKKPTLTKKTGGTNTAQSMAVEDEHRSSLPGRWLNEIRLRLKRMYRIRPSFVQELKPMTGENALWTLPQPTVGTTTNRDWKMSEFQGDTSPSIDTHSYERKQRKSTDSGLFSTECWKTKNNLEKQGFRINLS